MTPDDADERAWQRGVPDRRARDSPADVRADGGTASVGGERGAGTAPRSSTPAERSLAGRARELTGRGLAGTIAAARGGLAQPTVSDIATFGFTIAACLLIGGSLIGLQLATVATVGGVAAALVATLLASPNPLRRGIGGALAPPVAVLVAAPVTMAWAFALGVAGFGPFAAVTVWALIFAALAGTLTSWDRLGEGGARRAATGTSLVVVGVLVVLGIRLLPESGVRAEAGAAFSDLVGIVSGILVSPGPMAAGLSFFGLVFAAAASSWLAFEYVPFERLVPPDRRDEVSRLVGGVTRGCSLAIRLSLAGVLVVVMLPAILDGFEEVLLSPYELRTEGPEVLGPAFAWVLTAAFLRYLLILLIGLAVVLALAAWLRGALRRGLATVLARLLAPMIGGAALTVAVAYSLTNPAVEATLDRIILRVEPQSVAELLLEFPTLALVIGLVVVALGMLGTLLSTVWLLRTVRLLPPRAIGPSMAAVAVFALAISLAVLGRAEPAIATAVAAFVIWDVGEYADGIRTELGRAGATMRAELVHAGGALLIGGLVTVGTIALYRTVATDAPVVEPWLAGGALATSLLGLVAVAWILRK